MDAIGNMRSPHTQRDIPLDNIDDFLLANECTVCKAHANALRGAHPKKGVLCVTNFQLLFISASSKKSLRSSGGAPANGKGASIEEKIPLGLIERVEAVGDTKDKSNSSSSSLHDLLKKQAHIAVHCKDGRLCRFQFRNTADEKRIYHHIITFAFPVIHTNLFAFYNTPTAKSQKKVVDLYPHEQESDDEDESAMPPDVHLPLASQAQSAPALPTKVARSRSLKNDGILGAAEDEQEQEQSKEAPGGRPLKQERSEPGAPRDRAATEKRPVEELRALSAVRADSELSHRRSLSLTRTTVFATKPISENEFRQPSSGVETVTATSESKGTSTTTETETDMDDGIEDYDDGDLMMFDGWDIFSPKAEYLRLGVRVDGKELRKRLPKHLRSLQDATAMKSSPIFKSKWRLSKLNRNYELSPTYPRYIAIPRGITEAELRSVVEFRSKGRIPILCYIHRETYASICRSAQPLPRLGFSRCVADEHLLDVIRTSGLNPNAKLHILDARPRLNAMAQQATGKGCENLNYYPNTEYEFLGIENIHVIRESLKKLFASCRACLDEVAVAETEGGEVHLMETMREIQSTGWLDHIRTILNSADRIVNLIHAQGSSVVVHCSDGWDRTSQLTALAMLRVDPFYRTIEGFEVLIEKEWIAAGHQFQTRSGHGQHNTNNDRSRSPIFLQFLDCVWQMLAQKPDEFEFNEKFLIFLAESVYSCRFGTFLFDCEMERRQKDVFRTTTSVWSYTNCNPRFLNPRYRQLLHAADGSVAANHSNIEVLDVDADDVQVWMNYFLPTIPSSMKAIKYHASLPRTNTDEQLRKRIRELEDGQNQLLKTIHSLETENRRLLVDNEHLILQNLNLQEHLASSSSKNISPSSAPPSSRKK